MNLTKFEMLNQLKSLGIKIKSLNNNEIVAHCPFPQNHKNEDKNPSFGINLSTGKFLCRAGCIKGNSFEDLYEILTGKTYIDYKSNIELLEKNKITKVPQIPILPLAIDNFGEHYLQSRNINRNSIEKWGIMYWSSINGIVIPIEKIGYVIRYIDIEKVLATRDKYKYVAGTKITNCLFGESKLQFDLRFFIILVEGTLDAIWMHQCFPAGTRILMKNNCTIKRGGKRKIVTKKIEDINIGDFALSYNVFTGDKEFKKVKRIFHNTEKEILSFKFSNGNKFECTFEHPVAVNKLGKIEWVKAKELKIDDELLQYKYQTLGLRLNSLLMKDKRYKDIYGEEKGALISKKKSISYSKYRKNKTLFELYGHEIANKISKSISDRLKINNPMYKKDIAKAHGEKIRRLKLDPNSIYNSKEYKTKVSDSIRKSHLRRKHDNLEKYMQIELSNLSSCANKPNKCEKKMFEIIKRVAPKEFEYNSNKIIGVSMIPDFININGKNKIIEVFGEYWHKGENENIRINKFKEYGWDCLVVWEREIKNDVDSVERKIKNFLYNPNMKIIKIIEITHKNLALANEEVYNLEVEDNNNFFAHGILVHNCGYTNTMALLHTDISDIQMRILQKYNMPVYLLMDGDIPGKEAMEKLEKKLKYKFYVKKCYLPEGRDPNDCDKKELEKIIS